MLIKNTIKSLLMTSLLISGITSGNFYDEAVKASKDNRYKPTNVEIAMISIAGITVAITGLVLIFKYISHKEDYENACKDCLKQYEILNKFYTDQNFTYEMLLIEARNFFYEKYSNSNNLSSEYPVVWLEINTALNIELMTNKNWKNYTYFDVKYKQFSKKFDKLLTKLRNNPEFQKDRREYYAKLREEDFRDELLLQMKLNGLTGIRFAV